MDYEANFSTSPNSIRVKDGMQPRRQSCRLAFGKFLRKFRPANLVARVSLFEAIQLEKLCLPVVMVEKARSGSPQDMVRQV